MGSEREAAPVGDVPYFFLSYARTPRHDRNASTDPNRWVHQLYNDLSDEVMQITKSRIAGFMDREIRVGMQWSKELTTALSTCKVFVPLYSPRYFVSENCGKEWLAFSRRVLDQQARRPETGMAIVPALWVPVDEESLPNVAQKIQFDHYELGERYGADGFYGIMKITRYQDDYTLAVQALARRIVDVAKKTAIEPGPQADFETSESAFGDSAVHLTPEKRMQLTVVAPDISHLPNGRSKHYYGRRPHQWCPYFPAAPMPITDYAVQLTYFLGCEPNVGTLDDHVKDATNGRIAPGLLLIDAWATRSPSCRRQLRILDELDQDWTSVLLPWNKEDSETVRSGRKLRENIEMCLNRKLSNIPHRYRRAAIEIETIQDFGDVMAPMVMTMRRKFLKHAQPNLPRDPHPPRGSAAERPRLRASSDEGPEGTL